MTRRRRWTRRLRYAPGFTGGLRAASVGDARIPPISIPTRHHPRHLTLTIAMWFAIAAYLCALTAALSLLSGCATSQHVSRSYAACQTAARRVG